MEGLFKVNSNKFWIVIAATSPTTHLQSGRNVYGKYTADTEIDGLI